MKNRHEAHNLMYLTFVYFRHPPHRPDRDPAPGAAGPCHRYPTCRRGRGRSSRRRSLKPAAGPGHRPSHHTPHPTPLASTTPWPAEVDSRGECLYPEDAPVVHDQLFCTIVSASPPGDSGSTGTREPGGPLGQPRGAHDPHTRVPPSSATYRAAPFGRCSASQPWRRLPLIELGPLCN